MKTAVRHTTAVLLLLLCGATASSRAAVAADAPGVARIMSRPADQMARWVVASRDNAGRPFVIVDKAAAQVFAFDAHGQLKGAAPALLGLAHGDDAISSLGARELSAIAPSERVTEAGRFLARFGPGSARPEVLWINPLTRLSLHPVLTTNARERRWDRLMSAAVEDNRITFGCINVTAAFYYDVLRPAFGGAEGVVYILPETKRLDEVFPGGASDEVSTRR